MRLPHRYGLAPTPDSEAMLLCWTSVLGMRMLHPEKTFSSINRLRVLATSQQASMKGLQIMKDIAPLLIKLWRGGLQDRSTSESKSNRRKRARKRARKLARKRAKQRAVPPPLHHMTSGSSDDGGLASPSPSGQPF